LKALAAEVNINPIVLERLASISLIEYNPTKANSKNQLGLIEMQAKKLFQTIFPSLNIDMYGILL